MVRGESMCGTMTPLCNGNGDCINNDCVCYGRWGLRFCSKDFGSTSAWNGYQTLRWLFITLLTTTQLIAMWRVWRVVKDRWYARRGYGQHEGSLHRHSQQQHQPKAHANPHHGGNGQRHTCCYMMYDTQVGMLISLLISGVFRLLWIVDPYHLEQIWSQSTADLFLQLGSSIGLIGLGLFIRFFVNIQAKIHPPTMKVLRGLDIFVGFAVLVQGACLFVPGNARTVLWNLTGALFVAVLTIAGTIWSHRVLSHATNSPSPALRSSARRLNQLVRLLQVVVVLQVATLGPYSFLWPSMDATEYSVWIIWFRALELFMGMIGLWLMSRVHKSNQPAATQVSVHHGPPATGGKSLKLAPSRHGSRIGGGGIGTAPGGISRQPSRVTPVGERYATDPPSDARSPIGSPHGGSEPFSPSFGSPHRALSTSNNTDRWAILTSPPSQVRGLDHHDDTSSNYGGHISSSHNTNNNNTIISMVHPTHPGNGNGDGSHGNSHDDTRLVSSLPIAMTPSSAAMALS